MNSNRKFGKQLTVVFVTIDRNKSAMRFVSSVRQYFPKISILVADQNGPTDEMVDFYRENTIRMLWLPNDCGLSFARNRALEQVETPYVVLADDDFIFTDWTNLEKAFDVMVENPKIGFLGGRIIDIRADEHGNEKRFLRRWEKFMIVCQKTGTLLTVPIDYMPVQTMDVSGCKVYLCDMTLNWGVLRTSVFNEKIRWDEQIKINGEHEDFFLNLKQNSSWQVAYYPGLQCDHFQTSAPEYQKLRQRQAGRKTLAQKWKLTHHLEIGVGLRDYNDYLSFRETPIYCAELNMVEGEPELEAAPTPISKLAKQPFRLNQLSDNERALEEMEKQRLDLKRKVRRLELMVADKDEKLRQSSLALRALQKSWSWMLTAPLRKIASLGIRQFKDGE